MVIIILLASLEFIWVIVYQAVASRTDMNLKLKSCVR